MTTTFASLGLDHLSEEDKRAIIRDLFDEIELEETVPDGFATRDEMHEELCRRADADDLNPDTARDFFEVDAEILAELDGRGKQK